MKLKVQKSQGPEISLTEIQVQILQILILDEPLLFWCQ